MTERQGAGFGMWKVLYVAEEDLTPELSSVPDPCFRDVSRIVR